MPDPDSTKLNLRSRLMNLVMRRQVPEGPRLELGAVAIPFPELQRGGLVASGSPGSGLTSGVIVPVIDRLISGYGNATEKIGGLVIDADGNLLDEVVYAMARAGRDPVEELVCLRHSSDVPLARFRDPASGCTYLVNGQPSSSAGRSEAGRLIEKGQAGVPPKERIHPEICSRHERDSSAALPVLRNLKCRVAGDDVRYLGWRFADNSRATIVLKHGLGEKVARAAPKELIFEDVVRRPLGERFNPAGNASVSAEAYADMICDAFFPTAERGPAFAWVKAAIVAASCLCTRAGRTPSLSELCRLLVNEGLIAERLEALRRTAAPKGTEPDADAVAELARFFAEWAGLDSRLRHDLVALFTNAFGAFVTNETLARTFCGDPTFDFASVFHAGRIVVADVSRQPAMRSIAALIEADFQRAVLARSAAATPSAGRMLLNVVPLWAHLPITGAGAGPNDFLSEGFRNGVFNLLTVEPSDDALGPGDRPLVEAALRRISHFAWLRSDSASWNGLAAAIHGGCRPEMFAGLDPLRAVVRTSAAAGDRARNTMVRLKPGSSASADTQAAIAEFMRDFMRDWIEQALKTRRISMDSLV